jgi:phytoene dehydrogenase-like protein
VNPEVDGGWDAHRDTVAKLMIDTVDDYAPELRAQRDRLRALSPARPRARSSAWSAATSSTARWRSTRCSARVRCSGRAIIAVRSSSLYLCGSGTHPGGGVTGLPGRNAAREILKDLRKGPRPD